MSDPTANQTPAISVSLDGVQGAPTEPPAQPQAQPTEPALSQYAQDWLGQIPEADRGVVGKYLPNWDAGTQRRVADFQRQYAPLQQFVEQGYDVDDLQLGLQVMDMLAQDKDKGIEMLMQAVGYQVPGQPPAQPDPQQQNPAQVQLPPELTQQLQQQSQFMEQFALQQQQAQQAAADAQADQELDSYLSWLKQEKGDFDEGYVLSQMSQGVPGDQAVDQFNQIIQARLTAQQQSGPGNGALPPVPVLNGGAAATQQVPPAQMDDATRRNLVASMLNHANAQPG